MGRPNLCELGRNGNKRNELGPNLDRAKPNCIAQFRLGPRLSTNGATFKAWARCVHPTTNNSHAKALTIIILYKYFLVSIGVFMTWKGIIYVTYIRRGGSREKGEKYKCKLWWCWILQEVAVSVSGRTKACGCMLGSSKLIIKYYCTYSESNLIPLFRGGTPQLHPCEKSLISLTMF